MVFAPCTALLCFLTFALACVADHYLKRHNAEAPRFVDREAAHFGRIDRAPDALVAAIGVHFLGLAHIVVKSGFNAAVWVPEFGWRWASMGIGISGSAVIFIALWLPQHREMIEAIRANPTMKTRSESNGQAASWIVSASVWAGANVALDVVCSAA